MAVSPLCCKTLNADDESERNGSMVGENRAGEPTEHESELLAHICHCDAWEDATARIHKYAWDFIASRGEMEQKRLA